jgi:hypothetical protein
MLILAVAANTSFADFPRLSAILARIASCRQFTGLGDRLVFANGIVAGGGDRMLIIAFRCDSHALILPLPWGASWPSRFHSRHGDTLGAQRQKGWLLKAFLNGLGGLATLITLMVIGVSKFREAAWITVLVLPLLIAGLPDPRSLPGGGQQLCCAACRPPSSHSRCQVVMLISGVHRGMLDAMAFARSISPHVTALYIELEPGGAEQVRETWKRWFPDVPLVVRSSPYRSIVAPLLDYLDEVDRAANDGQLTAVVLPEFIPARWWQALLHNQTTWPRSKPPCSIAAAEGFQRVIINIPYHLKR